jgi:hypothetical protein
MMDIDEKYRLALFIFIASLSKVKSCRKSLQFLEREFFQEKKTKKTGHH